MIEECSCSLEEEVRAGANRRTNGKIPFSFKRRKINLQRKIGEEWGRSNTVAEIILGPLDCAKADPTTAIDFAISQSAGSGGGGLHVYATCDMAIADIAISDRISGAEER